MKPEEIVQKMLSKDYFSQWLGIKLVSLGDGECTLSMQIKKDMLNGFGIAHGGISYSFADSALAFASNSGGRQSLSIETSIAHTKSLKEGDEIIAEATRDSQSEKLGYYSIRVYRKNEPGVLVAIFRGTVYRTSREWE